MASSRTLPYWAPQSRIATTSVPAKWRKHVSCVRVVVVMMMRVMPVSVAWRSRVTAARDGTRVHFFELALAHGDPGEAEACNESQFQVSTHEHCRHVHTNKHA